MRDLPARTITVISVCQAYPLKLRVEGNYVRRLVEAYCIGGASAQYLSPPVVTVLAVSFWSFVPLRPGSFRFGPCDPATRVRRLFDRFLGI